MTSEADKCVIVIDEQLSMPLAVNASSVLAVTLGHSIEGIIGPDVVDGSGNVHLGFVRIPIPILKASGTALKTLWHQAKSMPTIIVVDLTETGQKARTYPEYQATMASVAGEDLMYVALAFYGPRKSINQLTGNLPLLK